MKKYVSHKTNEGTHIINLQETWEKIKIAARVIVTVENKADVVVCFFSDTEFIFFQKGRCCSPLRPKSCN